MKHTLKSLLITLVLTFPSIFASDACTSGSEDNRTGPAQPVPATATNPSADPQDMYLRACALADAGNKYEAGQVLQNCVKHPNADLMLLFLVGTKFAELGAKEPAAVVLNLC